MGSEGQGVTVMTHTLKGLRPREKRPFVRPYLGELEQAPQKEPHTAKLKPETAQWPPHCSRL